LATRSLQDSELQHEEEALRARNVSPAVGRVCNKSETVTEMGVRSLSSFAVLIVVVGCLLSWSVSQAQETSRPQAVSDEQKTIEELRAKLASDSLNVTLNYELANTLHDTGEREEALVYYDRALANDPEFVEALVNRGALLNELGFLNDAIASFERALSVRPNDAKALCNSGNSFYALKNYDEALLRYRSAVESDSTFVEGYYYIGVAFADAGIYREAIREWEKIINIAPNSDTAATARENIQTLKMFLRDQ
jgi:tetratricopeptide (TPR) repeat protein